MGCGTFNGSEMFVYRYLKNPFLAWLAVKPLILPSGKHTKNYGTSPFSMGKSTISMVIFNSYVKLPEGIYPQYIEVYTPNTGMM